MSENALVEAAYASARRQLKDARIAQQNAVWWGMMIYKPGKRGADARRMRKHWDEKRGAWLDRALAIRRNIRQLRVEIARLELAATLAAPPAMELHA